MGNSYVKIIIWIEITDNIFLIIFSGIYNTRVFELQNEHMHLILPLSYSFI